MRSRVYTCGILVSMNEDHPNAAEHNEVEQRRKEIIDLAIELSESRESFPFSGINPEDYAKIKADRDEYPELFSPMDELMERFKSQGIKVMRGNDPSSINAFILPGESTDIENDSIYPRHLQITDAMDERLVKLILLNKR